MNGCSKKLELTVPAGGTEQLIAAVNAGADSVYLGYKNYGARAYAENFDLDQIKLAVAFAHSRNVKVYLTLNTLLKDIEIRELLDFLKKYSVICTDGIIIQDFCLYKIIKDLFKHIPVHASTQINIHNIYSLKLMKRLGFKRVILARELTLNEIKDLSEENLTEIEIFIHGSQCYSYSGSCYFSSFISGRSGNRGRCPQPCRMKYKLLEEKDGKYKYIIGKESYILSKSDLFLLKYIPRIARAGIDSLKIEGRMKSAEYAGIVTKIYRKYIDLYYDNPSDYSINESDIYKLSQIYSREPGTGYIKDKYPREIIPLKSSGSTGNFLGRVYRVYHGEGSKSNKRHINVKSRWEISRGDILEIWTKKGNDRIYVKDIEVLEEKSRAWKYKIYTDKTDNISEKDRVFKYFDKKLNDEACSLYKYGYDKNISGRKAGKRNSVSEIERKIKKYINNFIPGRMEARSGKTVGKILLTASVYNSGYIESCIKNGARRIIYNIFSQLADSSGIKSGTLKTVKKFYKNKEAEIYIGTPHIIHDSDFINVKNNISVLLDSGINNYMVSNPGVLEFFLEYTEKNRSGINLYLGHNFNLFNTLSIIFFSELIENGCALRGIEFSRELNLKEITGIISGVEGLLKKRKPEFSILGHGYVPVMNSRYMLKFITGRENGGRYYIEDNKGYRFPVDSDYNGNMIIYNSRIISTLFDLEKILDSKIDNIILDSRFYSEKDFCKILKIYHEAAKIIYGEGIKKYKSFTSCLKDESLFKNFTRGHLLRGVE